MINYNDKCWICKSDMGKSCSEHHLFNYYDYRNKMIDTFPEIYKDKSSISKLRFKWKSIRLVIPSFKVHKSCHRELEKRLANLILKKNDFYWKNRIYKNSNQSSSKETCANGVKRT